MISLRRPVTAALTALLVASVAACTSHGGSTVTAATTPPGSAAASLPAAATVSRLASPSVKAACPVIAPTTASGDPLAKLSASQILMKARIDAEAEPTVCVSTSAMFQGAHLISPATVVMVSVKGGRCEGTAMAPGGGFATFIEIRSAIWVWANPAYARFLQPYVKGQTSEAVSARLGKWVLVRKLNPVTGQMFEICTNTSTLYASMTTPGINPSSQDTRVAGFTMIDGQRTVGVTDPVGDVTYVTDTARPLPAGQHSPMLGVTQDYFDFGISATVSAPPASDVVDGSKYGLG